jgi:hypothetical protein
VSILLFLILMALCCGYALARGGAPERYAAGLQIGAFVLTLLVHRLFEGQAFQVISLGTAAIDVVLLLALIVLAWRSTRFWPLWIAGWQLAAIVAHLAKLLDPAMLPAGYAIQAQIWAYPMLVATAAGAWRHRARRAAGDADPPWKPLPA